MIGDNGRRLWKFQFGTNFLRIFQGSRMVILSVFNSKPRSLFWGFYAQKYDFREFFHSFYKGSSTVCDRTLQKNRKIERRNWKRQSLHLASNTQKSFKWTGWTQWTQWTFCVIRKIKSSIWSIWSIWSIKCWFVSRQIKQAYGFKESEYFKLKIYHLPEISSGKSIWVSVTNRRWGKDMPLRLIIFPALFPTRTRGDKNIQRNKAWFRTTNTPLFLKSGSAFAKGYGGQGG